MPIEVRQPSPTVVLGLSVLGLHALRIIVETSPTNEFRLGCQGDPDEIVRLIQRCVFLGLLPADAAGSLRDLGEACEVSCLRVLGGFTRFLALARSGQDDLLIKAAILPLQEWPGLTELAVIKDALRELDALEVVHGS